MKRRVVVTGLGAITPIGNSVPEFWEGIKTGKVGIGEITKFDTSDYKVKIAAEVKDFEPKNYMDFKAAKRMEPFSCRRYRRLRNRKSADGGKRIHEDRGERAEPGSSVDGTADDLQYGGRKCFDSAWSKRKMYQCRDSVRFRHPLYWRRVPRDPVRGCGSDVRGRYGECDLPDRSSRIHGADSSYDVH